jgi:hypothetical protein
VVVRGPLQMVNSRAVVPSMLSRGVSPSLTSIRSTWLFATPHAGASNAIAADRYQPVEWPDFARFMQLPSGGIDTASR